jgi:hypothetical protein
VTQFPTPTNADGNGNLTLTATVLGGGSTAPTGTVSFLNTSTGNAALGTASLVAGTPGVQFPSGSQAYDDYYDGLAHSPTSVAVGDFNGDGFLDVAVADGSDVTIYLGDANGSLTSGQVIPNAGTSVVVGDFNGDGILDLVSGKNVFLGKGDGSFTPVSCLPAGSILAAADFNGDGILDLVSGTAVYLGNGDGTFNAGVNLPTSGDFVAVDDFNGDGIPDLAVSSISGESVSVLLGKGDGSFAAGATNLTSLQKGSQPGPVVGADLTGNGFQDLVVANNDGTFTVQLNDGKGNFTLTPNSAQINICPGLYSIHPCYGAGSGGIQVSDINGDGIPDLVVGIPFVAGTTPSGYAWALLGDGKGDFPTSVPTGGAPEGMAVGDFNGDGIPDVVVASPGETHADDVSVSFAANQTATATATGVQLAPATGWQLVVASYPGDNNYKSSISSPDSLQPPPPPSTLLKPTVVVTATANTAVFGTSVTFWVTVSGSGPTPTGSVTLNGSAPLDGKGVAGGFTINDLPVGSDSMTATYSGDANYQPGTSAAFVITISQAASTTTVTPEYSNITDSMIESVNVSVGGGPNVTTGTVTLSGGTYSAMQILYNDSVTFTIAPGTLSSGVTTLTANYSGDDTYLGSTATATITVSQVAINIPPENDIPRGGSLTAPVILVASSTYSGTINLTCTLSSSPAGAQNLPTCSLSPASVTLASGGNTNTTLTVNTTGTSTASLVGPFGKSLWGMGGGAALAALLMLGVPSRRRRWMSMIVLLAAVVAGGALGCGGGGSTSVQPPVLGTTVGNYVFTLTGTDSANSQTKTSVNYTVVVR